MDLFTYGCTCIVSRQSTGHVLHCIHCKFTLRFAVFPHRDDTPFKGSKASLGSSMKLDTDDEASLLEYGEPDSMKFNEDGSFIGQYQDRNRRYDPSAV